MPERIIKPRIQMIVNMVRVRNRNGIMIRKTFVDRDIIKNIVLEILKRGVFEFNGEIVFMNKEQAVSRLKETNLI
jgi:hypothetical protein